MGKDGIGFKGSKVQGFKSPQGLPTFGGTGFQLVAAVRRGINLQGYLIN